ncbi:hypothetical protein RDWZM_000014 [Blomia tropicalis]|uniref:Caspase family p10 domain-containing protein n=1 Tax=Blomia tropicalis TaxID=40697 RepID=A0A9Q0RP60_BLOTA|nr:hypothetical protein RDWZM_000014 [Blomia tropicalis]
MMIEKDEEERKKMKKKKEEEEEEAVVVKVHDDLSYSETIALIQKESKRHDNLNLNCFVLFILSHQTISKNGSALFWCRDNCLSLELIVDQMTKPSCSMAGRPKIILMEVGHDYKTGTLAHDSLNLNPPKKPNQYLIPRYADWIMFKLSHNGYMLSHLEKNGSIYIRKLCDILRKYSQQHDLSTILTMVSGSIHQIDQTQYGNAMIQIISTLTHLIQFNYKSHE